MKRVLLTVMFVLSLFIMCGCGEGNRRGDRHSEWRDQDRHSEQYDRDRDRHSESRYEERR